MAENIASFAILLLKEISSECDSSSDEEWELLKKKRKRILRPCMQNVEFVIELYSNDDFKSHFRLNILFFKTSNVRISIAYNFGRSCAEDKRI